MGNHVISIELRMKWEPFGPPSKVLIVVKRFNQIRIYAKGLSTNVKYIYITLPHFDRKSYK
jgi:hypothetical protein